MRLAVMLALILACVVAGSMGVADADLGGGRPVRHSAEAGAYTWSLLDEHTDSP